MCGHAHNCICIYSSSLIDVPYAFVIDHVQTKPQVVVAVASLEDLTMDNFFIPKRVDSKVNDGYDDNKMDIDSFCEDEDDNLNVFMLTAKVRGDDSSSGKNSKDDEWSNSRAFRGSCRR